jgi:hypothetical protein
MAFADPQTVTINAVAETLNRISSEKNQSEYLTSDSEFKLTVAHAYGKRVRRTIRIDRSRLQTDVLNPVVMSPYSMSCYLVVDHPILGFTTTEQQQLVDGFVDYLDASSGARIFELLGGEN